MIEYIQSFLAIILGIVSSISDFRKMKIYNKNIKIAIIISFIVYLLFINQLDFLYLKNYLINFLISILISFVFYYFKIWAAGDAKLFLTIVFMIPYHVYQNNVKNIFPAIYLLIMIFSVAFVYVVLESIFLWIKDKNKFKRFKLEKPTKQYMIEFLLNYLLGYFIILFVNNLLSLVFIKFNLYNGSLIMLCNMLFLIFIYQIIKNRKQKLIITFICLILNVIYYSIHPISLKIIDYKMLVIVLIIILFRKISEQYNYKEIKINDLKARMILSYESVFKFYGSKVKGLPKITTESTDSRLTENEVLSIKRWSRTKRGEDSIVIVKHLPFAPFILVGEIIFFVIKIYMR